MRVKATILAAVLAVAAASVAAQVPISVELVQGGGGSVDTDLIFRSPPAVVGTDLVFSMADGTDVAVSLPDLDSAPASVAFVDNGRSFILTLDNGSRISGAVPASVYNPPGVSDAEAEAGTETQFRLWSPAQVRRAIVALAPAGGGTATIADRSVTEPKLADQAVTKRAMAFDSVGFRQLEADSVRSGHIVDNAITGADIASNQVITRHIVSQSIIRGLMAGDSVGSTEIVDGDIAEDDLNAAVRAKLNASGGGGSARAFGSGSGEIAPWAEGDSTARLPDAKTPSAVSTALDRRDVFGTITVNPPGIPGRAFPEFMAVTLSNKLDSRTLAEIRVSLNGIPIGAVTDTGLGPFNGLVTLNGEQVGGIGGEEGGVINLAINAVNRANLANNITTAPQWITLELAYKFDGTSLVPTVPADAIDRAAFAVNNNGYDPVRNPAFSGHILPAGGSDGQFLSRASGAPAWVAAPSGGGGGTPDLRALFTTASTPAAVDRFFFTDENISGDPVRYTTFFTLQDAIVDDDQVLDVAQGTRAAADRGKFLAVSATDEDNLVLTTAPTSTAAEPNLLLDSPGSPIQPSARNEAKVLYRTGQFYRVQHIHATDPTATYRDFAATDLPRGYTWGGVVQVSPTASAQPDNRIVYSIPGEHFLRKVNIGGARWVIWTPANWRGHWASESEADAHVTAVGDIVFYAGSVRVVTAYTARTPESYEWVPVAPRPDPAAATRASRTTVLDTYTLRDTDTMIAVEVLNDIQSGETGYKARHYSITIARSWLSTTGKHYVMDTRLPEDTPDDDNDRVVGFIASIRGNTLTLSRNSASGDQRYLGTVTNVTSW